MTFLLGHLWLALMVLYVATLLVVCHSARAWDRLWWWRHDGNRTMRREMEK